jgi:osmoprotectant transport system substrate-binding protein
MKAASKRVRGAAAMGAALTLLLAGCGGSSDAGGGEGTLSGASFNVGSKEFTESKVLAQITADVLKNAGATVKTSSLTGSATVREALQKGEIDMYWEYTGTGWVNILGKTTTDVPKDLYEQVSAADKANKIAWLQPAPMNDTYRIAVTEDFGAENNIATMSDAAKYIADHPGEGKVCAASEFLNRDDGLPGLQKAYDLTFSGVSELDLGLIYTQIGKTCNFGEVFSTDGRVVANKLRILDDDKKFFVDYNAALTIRQETLDKNPGVAEVMKPISQALTNEEITKLNAKVDVDGENESDVAKEWLEDKNLLG